MKLPMPAPAFRCFLPSVAMIVAPQAFAETSLQIENPQPYEITSYSWFDDTIWSSGVPGSEDDVVMNDQSGESGSVRVGVDTLGQDVTIGSLRIETNTELSSYDGNFFVTGTTEATGFLAITRGQMSLGTNVLYDPDTKTLNGGQCLVSDGHSETLTIYEWRGADIVHNGGGFNLFGTNVIVRDQNTGINAFQNLATNSSFLVLDDGYVMNISGNFTNTEFGSIELNLNESVRTPELNIAGNFRNDGLVELNGNTILNVSGGLSGSGRIVVTGSQNQVSVVGVYTQDGGEVTLGDEGGSGIDSFTLKASAHIYSGGATVSGNGTLEGTVTITSGTISPGFSPGQVTVAGDLILEEESVLKLEIGGTTAITGFDRIRQIEGDAGVTLGGQLQVDLINGFYDTIQSANEFAVLTSEQGLQGSFSNVADGERLTTTDGRGSFLVEYGASSVTLSDFQVNPETFAAWLARYELPEGQDGPEDDPNEDGIENLEAYVRGISPVGADTARTYTAIPAEGGILMRLSTSKALEGVEITTQISSDLNLWSAGPVATVVEESATRQTLQILLPVSGEEPKFGRFVFEEELPEEP